MDHILRVREGKLQRLFALAVVLALAVVEGPAGEDPRGGSRRLVPLGWLEQKQ